MAFLDALARLLRTALRLILWAVAALFALGLVSLALVFFLSWFLVGLALGRKPQVSLRARVQRMREFGGGLGPSGLRTGRFWGSPGPSEAAATRAETPLAQRISPPGAVQDVEVKETRPRTGD
jgi:hypothetical protein